MFVNLRVLDGSISIHALLTESDHAPSHSLYLRNISIHALLTESDPSITGYFFNTMHFYPRSPYGERRVDFFFL